MSFAKLVRHMIKKEAEKKPESEIDDSSISDVSSSDRGESDSSKDDDESLVASGGSNDSDDEGSE